MTKGENSCYRFKNNRVIKIEVGLSWHKKTRHIGVFLIYCKITMLYEYVRKRQGQHIMHELVQAHQNAIEQ